ncbi:MAG TPA: hypothetical protein PK257_02835 [Candidatus Woesebacteria bacterium]|nr:hypothetical protein [Candidatus Woesebacteria bacterium]
MVLISKFKSHFDKIILASVLLILFCQNFSPHTWLVGWDNLLPELNIWLNLKRSLLAVWQEYQGLGLVGGMGHATELIRQLIILPFTLILPTNLIRYLWQFLMLTLGTFSLNIGLKKIFNLSKNSSLLASLFYLLNFGTVQYFWVTFEPFATFWGFFPALFFLLWNYLKTPNRKNLVYLILINLLAIPSFYVQTIFIVYFICCLIILISNLISNFNKTTLKVHFVFLINLILINSFWLLPLAYYFKNDLNNTIQSFGNYMANQETFDRNQNRGTIGDFLILRNYYVDFPNNYDTLFPSWNVYFSNKYNLICGYLVSIFVIIGLIYFISKLKKSPIKISLVLIFLLSSIALLSATPVFSQINYFIRQIPVLNQIFRSPWTKFFVPTAFVFSVFIAFGLESSFNFFKKIKYSPSFSKAILSLFFIFSLFKFIFPVFQGQFFSPLIKQNIPNDYLELIKYFNQISPTARIMNLPQGSFWGWTTYRWGVKGSGFLWYGLKQPILDRAFDVWSLKNEKYYWELNTAIQQKNPQALNKIIDKYSIEYVIFDRNIYFTDELTYAKLSSTQFELLNQIDNLKLVKNIGSIYIYQNIRPSQVYTTNNIEEEYPISSFDPNFYPKQLPDSSSVIYSLEHGALTENKTTKVITSNQLYFHFENKFSHNLLGFNFPDIKFDQDYLLKIESRNTKGQTPIISAFDNLNRYYFFKNQLKKSDEWQTSWFLIPKMENFSFDTGLTVLFDNPSFNQNLSINDIKNPEIYPYQNNISLINDYQSPNNNYLSAKSNIFYYKVKFNQTNNKYLVLPQSFHKGWIAFYFQGFKPVFLKNHTLVNNWANGWQIPSNNPTTVYLFFWPQIFEFLGFILLIPAFIFIFRSNKK